MAAFEPPFFMLKSLQNNLKRYILLREKGRPKAARKLGGARRNRNRGDPADGYSLRRRTFENKRREENGRDEDEGTGEASDA